MGDEFDQLNLDFNNNPYLQQLMLRERSRQPLISEQDLQAAAAERQRAQTAFETPQRTDLASVLAASLGAALPAIIGGVSNGIEGAGHGGKGAVLAMDQAMENWDNQRRTDELRNQSLFQAADENYDKLTDTARDDEQNAWSRVNQILLGGGELKEKLDAEKRDRLFDREMKLLEVSNRPSGTQVSQIEREAIKEKFAKAGEKSATLMSAIDTASDPYKLAKGISGLTDTERRMRDMLVRQQREASRNSAPGVIHSKLLDGTYPNSPDRVPTFSDPQRKQIQLANSTVPEILQQVDVLRKSFDPEFLKKNNLAPRMFINPINIDKTGLTPEQVKLATHVAQQRFQAIQTLVTLVKNKEGMGAAFTNMERELIDAMIGMRGTDLTIDGVIDYLQKNATNHDPLVGINNFAESTVRRYIDSVQTSGGELDIEHWSRPTTRNGRDFLRLLNSTSAGRSYLKPLLQRFKIMKQRERAEKENLLMEQVADTTTQEQEVE